MTIFTPLRTSLIALSFFALISMQDNVLFAQGDGGGGNGGGGAGGITINPQGVVNPVNLKPASLALEKRRLQAVAAKNLSKDLNRPSEMRVVSLVKLEQAIDARLRAGQTISDEMKFLAGLQRIDFVFIYPDENDIVIAGPADGFAMGRQNRVVGVNSGRPVMLLEDLVVALRSRRAPTIGVSIDPYQQKLAALNQALSRPLPPLPAGRGHIRFQQMANMLGNHKITVQGVPDDSHYARTLVEADYRMKRMAMGFEGAGIPGFRSHLSLIVPNGNTMQRWWFTPLYDAIYTSEDGNAFKLAGQRLQLSAQDEVVNAAGQRANAATTRISSQKFAQIFTKQYPKIAERMPCFAELQTLVDLAILGALIDSRRLDERIGWKMDLFADRNRLDFGGYTVPRETPPTYACKRHSRGMLLGLVGGGVTINPRRALADIPQKDGTSLRLSGLRQQAENANRPAEHPWWWD